MRRLIQERVNLSPVSLSLSLSKYSCFLASTPLVLNGCDREEPQDQQEEEISVSLTAFAKSFLSLLDETLSMEKVSPENPVRGITAGERER